MKDCALKGQPHGEPHRIKDPIPKPTEQKHDRHYCRFCPEVFEPSVNKAGPSAHTSGVLHMTRQHRAQQRPQITCTRYCDMHVQPEELRAGLKLYGAGSQRVANPRVKYEEIAPEE